MSDEQEKTEEATPERRKKAREDGQFPRGKDAGNTAGSLAVMLTLIGLFEFFRRILFEFFWECLHEPGFLTHGNLGSLLVKLGAVLASLVFPLAGAAALGATAAGLAEAGYHPKLELAYPKWNRLEPLGKLKQMFSPQHALVNVALQLGRVVAVAVVAVMSVRSAFPRLVQLSRTELKGGALELGAAIMQLAVAATLALVVLVVVDYTYNKVKHEKQIMMSKQEIKEEMKQQEGDPRVRARQRAKAREIARRSVLQAVADSDFVIANPTHVSVAVRYRPEEGAPVVTAKGYDEAALHIRALAKDKKIPVVENIQLARELAKRVKVGRQIPVDLYAAVAEVLALVYRLKGRKLSA